MGTHSFPKGQGTLFTGIYIYIHVSILVHSYIYMGSLCCMCLHFLICCTGRSHICNASQI